jgi:anti-sigma regulatory factor (Ser/Thr protein kinase)
MCRVVSTVLPGSTRSPGQARAWTHMWLDSWDIDDEGVTTLLVSELVTNAVKYTRANTALTLAVANGVIEVGVTDNGSSLRVIPTQRDIEVPGGVRVLSESGRGLIIVEALSHEWGVLGDGIGKQVWFQRPVAADWPYATACPCRSQALTAHPLPSGRYAVAVPGPWDHP